MIHLTDNARLPSTPTANAAEGNAVNSEHRGNPIAPTTAATTAAIQPSSRQQSLDSVEKSFVDLADLSGTLSNATLASCIDLTESFLDDDLNPEAWGLAGTEVAPNTTPSQEDYGRLSDQELE